MPDTCMVCGRKLKHPESIRAGIGSTCRRRRDGMKHRVSALPSAKPSREQLSLLDVPEKAKEKLPAFTVVRRPKDAPRLPFETDTVIYPDGTNAPGEHYWTANALVASVLGDLVDNPHRKWAVEALNAAVISGAS